ncbi:hypothetical protein RRG08_064929 [Elysia crispata]|uniref:Uncharacterized protein n=1 Tax=Elysia crispata TaxID=231223 RepID=A0AAE0XN72_9GAST|nr:hypothetical protein RRG08_064929 [Elysia crispata]
MSTSGHVTPGGITSKVKSPCHHRATITLAKSSPKDTKDGHRCRWMFIMIVQPIKSTHENHSRDPISAWP